MADPNDLSLFGISNSAHFNVKRTKNFELLRKEEKDFSQKEREKLIIV